MEFIKKQIFVTIKAYPNPSTKYGETVCCAGIDLSNNQWIRLYPIPYRDLDNNSKFKKYSILEVDCIKPIDDKRPESFRINPDSIKVIEWFNTKDNWEKRKSFVLKLPIKSMCQVYEDGKEKDLSLGLIKPEKISFGVEKKSLSNQQLREECYAQLSFFDKQKNAIEEIPFKFFYNFQCTNEKNCPGHKLTIIDWEIGQAYRNWRHKYSSKKILFEKIEERWMNNADTVKKDVYFYVGNMKRFRNTFMVLGLFYPPK